MRNLKRTLAALLALGAVAAPAAALAASSASQKVVAHIDRTGTVQVSGYDGGAPLQP